MHRYLVTIVCIAMASARGEEPAPSNGSKEGLEILKKTAAALRDAKTVSYKGEYRATGWLEQRVPAVDGTAIMGEESKYKIERFYSEIKMTPSGSTEVVELSAGSDGNEYFLIDPKTKMCHKDLDPAVLGKNSRNAQRLLIREFAMAEPFADELKAGAVELKGSTKVGEEDCLELYLFPEGGTKRLLAISKKDFLPRRATNLIKSEQGEATTVLTVSDLVVNPTFVRDPFELRCPEGFKQTDEFAP